MPVRWSRWTDPFSWWVWNDHATWRIRWEWVR